MSPTARLALMRRLLADIHRAIALLERMNMSEPDSPPKPEGKAKRPHRHHKP